MLSINSISKGIVIDHIKAGLGVKIFELLKLKQTDFTVALIMNVVSNKLGRKDIIKIENKIDIDLNVLSILDANITINIIENERIREKLSLTLPKKIIGIIRCTNPRCISNSERNITQSLALVNEEKVLYKCDFCEHLYGRKDIKGAR